MFSKSSFGKYIVVEGNSNLNVLKVIKHSDDLEDLVFNLSPDQFIVKKVSWSVNVMDDDE